MTEVALAIMAAYALCVCIKRNAGAKMREAARMAVSLIGNDFVAEAERSGKDMEEASLVADDLAKQVIKEITTPACRLVSRMSVSDFDSYLDALLAEQEKPW